MKTISREDTIKLNDSLAKVLITLGSGINKAEIENEITNQNGTTIVSIKGYWVIGMVRIDINFKEGK